MDWLGHNYKEVIATLISLGVISGLWTWFHGWRGRRLEERRAAAALIASVTNYKLYWIAKHYDELNAQHNEEVEIQWGGDPFVPVLSTSALEAIASRLSKPLRKEIFQLQALSHKWKTDISVAYDYDTEDIDIIGPLAAAQLAIAADALLKHLAREAQVADPETGHSPDSIREREEDWSQDRVRWKEAQQAANKEFWQKHLAETSKPESSDT